VTARLATAGFSATTRHERNRQFGPRRNRSRDCCSCGAACACGGKRRLIDDLPPQDAGRIHRLVELKGTAEVATPLTAYLSGQRCVHYAYHVDEHWFRDVTETYTDKDGNTQTRTKHESGWTTVARGGQTEDFYLQDDTGTVWSGPPAQKLESAGFFDETCERLNRLYYSKGPMQWIADSDHRRRFVETGSRCIAALSRRQARERAMSWPGDCPPTRRRRCFSSRHAARRRCGPDSDRQSGRSCCSDSWHFPRDSPFATTRCTNRWPPGAALRRAGRALSCTDCARLGLDGIQQPRRAAQPRPTAWSLIDVQLKRRHDLIPRLVETRCRVTNARRPARRLQWPHCAISSPPLRQASRAGFLRLCAPTLRAIAEAYPNLKSDTAFLRLQKELVENRAAHCPGAVLFQRHRDLFQHAPGIVPDRWIAALGRMQPQALLARADFERAAVQVKLAE